MSSPSWPKTRCFVFRPRWEAEDSARVPFAQGSDKRHRPLPKERETSGEHAEVRRRRTFGTDLDLVLHPLSGLERLHAGRADRRLMHEDRRTAEVRRDEAKALGVVERPDDAGDHF